MKLIINYRSIYLNTEVYAYSHKTKQKRQLLVKKAAFCIN